MVRAGQRQAYFLCHGDGLRLGQVGMGAQAPQHHHKLIAAQTRHRIDFTDAGHQPRGHLDQQQIAHAMAMRVIERFEVVQVQQHQRTVLPGALAAGQGLLQPLVQHAPVGQARQAVVIGQVADLLLGLFALGDVGVDYDGAQPAFGQRRDGHEKPALLCR